MVQKGSHTWELVWQYHLCPHCQHIIESRCDYTLNNNQLVKEITCPYCYQNFIEEKPLKRRSRSLFKSHEPVEWDWPEK